MPIIGKANKRVRVLFNRRFGLKFKMILASSSLSILMVGLLSYLALEDFKKDKLAQIQSENIKDAHSIAKQVQAEIKAQVDVIAADAKKIIQKKKSNYQNAEFWNKESLRQLWIFKKDKPREQFQLINHLSKLKEPDHEISQLNLITHEAYITGLSLQINDLTKNVWWLGLRIQVPNKRLPVIAIAKIKNPDFFRSIGIGQQGAKIVINRRKPIFDGLKPPAQEKTVSFWQKLNDSLDSTSPASSTRFRGKKTWLVSRAKTGIKEIEVISLIPLDTALQPIRLLTVKFVIAFFLLICLIFIGTVLFSKGLTRNLNSLVYAMQKVRDGDLNFKAALRVKDEIGDLAGHFNEMTKKIKDLMKETAEKARMESELETAKIVQADLFPDPYHEDETIKISGFYQPANECGGDWWFHSQIGQKTFLWLGDATGHGASAALVTSAAKSAANVVESFGTTDLTSILAIMNNAIYETTKGRVNMTFFLACFDKETNVLTYSRASHDPPIFLKNSDKPLSRNKIDLLFETSGRRLGESKGNQYETAQVTLAPGDRIFFYTDGITELMNPEQKMFGDRKLLKILTQSFNENEPVNEMMEKISYCLEDFRQGEPLHDDLTYFVFERKAS